MENSEKSSKRKRIISYILKDLALFGTVAAAVVLMNLIFGYSCPTKLFLRLDCPFCGMTRAHLAALRLDFKGAMEYHSLFFLGVPYIYLVTHDELFKGKAKKAYYALVISLTALFIIRYVINIFLQFP